MSEISIDPKTIRTLGARIDRKHGSAWRFSSKLKMPKAQKDLALAMSFPSVFAKIILGLELSEKQAQAVDACRMAGSKVSVLAGNGAGKTARCLTVVALWHQWVFPGGKTKITSGSFTQIEDQIWPSITEHKDKFPDWKWLETPYCTTLDADNKSVQGFINCFTTNSPGRAEGDHNKGRSVPLRELLSKGHIQDPKEAEAAIERLKHGDNPMADDGEYPLLYIVDECKTAIAWLEGVIIGRVRPARLLVLSSPGFAEGWFFRTQTSDESFTRIQIKADDCWWIPKEEIAAIRNTWKEYPEFAGSILGENFLSLVEDAVINGKALDELLANPPQAKPKGDRHLFCDFAWSNDGDENVLAFRQGNVVTIEKCFHCDHLEVSRKSPTPGIVDQCIAEFIRLGFSPGDVGQISGDEGGGGQLVMDALDARGWFLNRVNNQSSPADAEHYANSAAEMWYELGRMITGKSIVLPNDQMMRGQLLNRKRVLNNKGKLAVESKKDMKERGVPSPDRADACVPAGTLIHTAEGMRPIEKIKIGDFILTPMGYSKVVELHRREVKELTHMELSNGRKLVITPNHKIFTKEDGWVRADSVLLTHSLESASNMGIWNILNLLFVREENIGFKRLVDIIKTKTGTANAKDFFIGSSGLSDTDLFLKVCASIIKMSDGGTTETETTNSKHFQNIQAIIPENYFSRIVSGVMLFLRDCIKRGSPLPSGIVLQKAWNGTGSTVFQALRKGFQHWELQTALSAESSFKSGPLEGINFVAQDAVREAGQGGAWCRAGVLFVALCSWLQGKTTPALAPRSVQPLSFGKSVEVYNLTLAEENVYYADGLLVQNCAGCAMPTGGFGNAPISWAIPIACGEYQSMEPA